MSFWKNILHEGLYHAAHPLLRAYRIIVQPQSSGARAILIKDGEILLIRNIGVNYWSLPGGVLRRWETPISCLRRELREELGVSVTTADYKYKLGTYTFPRGKSYDVIHIFVIEVHSFYFKKQWEIDEAQWFYINDLPDNLSPSTKQRLAEFKSGKKNIFGVW